VLSHAPVTVQVKRPRLSTTNNGSLFLIDDNFHEKVGGVIDDNYFRVKGGRGGGIVAFPTGREKQGTKSGG
jgi:hypothetical protein